MLPKCIISLKLLHLGHWYFWYATFLHLVFVDLVCHPSAGQTLLPASNLRISLHKHQVEKMYLNVVALFTRAF